MTVEELIKWLQHCPKDLKINIQQSDDLFEKPLENLSLAVDRVIFR